MYMLSNQPRFSWFSVVSCLFPLKRVCLYLSIKVPFCLVDFRCSIGETLRDIQIDGFSCAISMKRVGPIKSASEHMMLQNMSNMDITEPYTGDSHV